MNIRQAKKDENKNIRDLWEEIFPEDSKAYLDFYFQNVIKENHVIVAEVGENNIVAMLHLNPYRVYEKHGEKSLYYVVAVGTKKDYRRQGIMKKMLDFAEKYARERQIYGLILLPEDERYYQPFGYEFVSKQYVTTLDTSKYAESGSQNQNEKTPLTYRQFQYLFLEEDGENANVLAERNFTPVRTPDLAKRLYQELISEDGQVFSVNKHLIFVYSIDEKIIVRRIYYNQSQLAIECDEHYRLIKEFLVNLAQGKALVIQEVQSRKVSKIFPYNRHNVYECRPYMMLKNICDTRQENFVFFDETV